MQAEERMTLAALRQQGMGRLHHTASTSRPYEASNRALAACVNSGIHCR